MHRMMGVSAGGIRRFGSVAFRVLAASACAVLILSSAMLRPAAAESIQTVAGGGSSDGLQASQIDVEPYGVATDARGDLYVSDQANHRVLRIDAASSVATTVAGNGTAGDSGDGGPATSAGLSFPSGIAFDASGNLYIADSGNNRIRRVDGRGTITTVAGNSVAALSGDGGPAVQANLNSPQDVALDGSGNLYIADSGNNRIRRIDASSGIITTVAGTTQGFGGDGGPATSAKLTLPFGVGLDADGNLLIADSGNNRIRRVDSTSRIITTVAGTGSSPFNGEGLPVFGTNLAFPMDVGVDAEGNILIVDSNNSRLRRVVSGLVQTMAGTRVRGFSGDGGAAALSQINTPSTLAVDSSGDIYIADTGNKRVRRIDGRTRDITTAAGTGSKVGTGDGLPATAVLFNRPANSTDDGSGGFYIAEQNAHKIRHVDSEGIVSTLAGTGVASFAGDGGPASAADLSSPTGICRDGNGSLYIADSGNNRIRKVVASGGQVSPSSTIVTVAGGGTALGDNGPATSARLSAPESVVVDDGGNLYIADAANNRIRKVDPRGIVTTVVGTGTWGFGGDGGPGAQAQIALPWSLALDRSGNLYIADLQNNRVRRYDIERDVITTIAGDGQAGFGGDGGPAVAAHLSGPSGIAIDAAGNVIIADSSNRRIRRVDVRTGIIETIAGSGVRYGIIDGQGGDPRDDLNDGSSPLLATFRNPSGLSANTSRSVLISDPDLGRVRQLSLSTSDPSPSPSPTRTAPPTSTRTPTSTQPPTSTPTPAPCVCDCNADGNVTISETVACVNIYLHSTPLSACPESDADGDGKVTIDDVVSAVNSFLLGPDLCPRVTR